MTTIIILSVVAILLLVGATQRKKLALLIRSEVKDFTDKQLSNVKVLKVRIEDIKSKGREMVDQAANLEALEQKQVKLIETLNKDLEVATNTAKKAKEAKDKDKAIIELAKVKELNNQITLATQNKNVANKSRLALESKISKIKTQISTYEIQIQGLEARKATNDVLNKISIDTVNNDTINNAIDNLEDKVSTEEIKLDYKVNLQDDSDNDYSKDLEEEYENL